MDFLPKRCLLVVADQVELKALRSIAQGGHISFWRTRPHPDQWTCIFHFRRSQSRSKLAEKESAHHQRSAALGHRGAWRLGATEGMFRAETMRKSNKI